MTALTVGAGVRHDGDLEAGCCAANGGGEEAESGCEIHGESVTVVFVAMSVVLSDNECDGVKTRGEEGERVVRKEVAASL